MFLTAVLAAAAAWGLWPSLFACLLSVLAYNFFFLPPLYTFTIADPENVVALVFFLITAVVASNLAAAVRAQAVAARLRARTTDELYQFSRKLAAIATLDDLLWAAVYQVAAMLKVRVVLLLPEGEGIAVRAGYPPEDTLEEGDLAAARWAWQHNRPAGRGSDTLPGGRLLFLPLGTGRGPVAVMGIESADAAPGPALADARPAPAARRARRPDRGVDRAHHARRGRRPRPPDGGDRAAALGAADLHLARPAHPARLHPGRRQQPGELRRAARPGGQAATCCARSRRRPSGSAGSSPTCST